MRFTHCVGQTGPGCRSGTPTANRIHTAWERPEIIPRAPFTQHFAADLRRRCERSGWRPAGPLFKSWELEIVFSYIGIQLCQAFGGPANRQAVSFALDF